MSWRSKFYKLGDKLCSKLGYINVNLLIYVFVPAYYLFLVTTLRSDLAQDYGIGVFGQLFHVALSTFLYLNCVANLLQNIYSYLLLIEHEPRKEQITSLRDIRYSITGCFNYGADCIGIHSKRYYFLYLFYFTLLSSYGAVATYFHLWSKYEYVKIFEKLSTFYKLMMITCNRKNKTCFLNTFDGYIVLLYFNIGFCITSYIVSWYRISKYLEKFPMKCSWKECFVRTFGVNWQLALLWPFAESPEKNNFSNAFDTNCDEDHFVCYNIREEYKVD